QKFVVFDFTKTVDDSLSIRLEWCSYCSKNKSYSLNNAKRVANNKNRECLSENYINSILLLQWRCAEEHKWYSTLRNIKYYNTWCPDCTSSKPLTLEEAKQIAYSRNGTKRLTLEEAKQIAYSRNDKCLSEIFVNIHLPLL
ncbi:6611_t:CDS:2, partial [Racocetra fulgida]